MLTGTRRWLYKDSLVMCLALANAASVSSFLPNSICAAILPGAPGHTSGASLAEACSIVITAGSSSYSTATCSAASSACARVSATTAATASPTWRTTSTTIGLFGGPSISLPSARFRPGPIGNGPMPSVCKFAPVKTANTPGFAFAADASIETMRACA